MADTWGRDRIRKLAVRGPGWFLCLAVWTVALLSLLPVEIGQAVTPAILHFPAAKFLHFSAYAFLTVYITWLPLRRWRWLLLALLSLHGAGTEYFQQFVPGRHSMVSDVFLDNFGLLAGVVLTWKRWLPRLSSSSHNRDPKGSANEYRCASRLDGFLRFRSRRSHLEIHPQSDARHDQNDAGVAL